VTQKPPIIGWARPLGYASTDYHGVIEIDPRASTVTACNGRWSTTEPTHYLEGRDRTTNNEGRPFTPCGACNDIAKEQRLREGLKELRDASIERPSSREPWWQGEFDVSDIGGEG